MLYIVWAVIITIAVVLGIFTGIWGGLIWLVAAGIVAAVIFAGRARQATVERAATEPTGRPRTSPGAIAAFKAVLEEHGVRATVRLTRGRDIDAACGQLAAKPAEARA